MLRALARKSIVSRPEPMPQGLIHKRMFNNLMPMMPYSQDASQLLCAKSVGQRCVKITRQLHVSTAVYAMEEEGEIESSDDSYLDEGRFPEVHKILVERVGRYGGWQNVRAILTQHRDRRHRQRRVWISFLESKPTKEELALQWPMSSTKQRYRKLRDDKEDVFRSGSDDLEIPREFTVLERTDTEGRLFWREVIKVGEKNDEEEDRDWEETMEDEGFNGEIGRLMLKD